MVLCASHKKLYITRTKKTTKRYILHRFLVRKKGSCFSTVWSLPWLCCETNNNKKNEKKINKICSYMIMYAAQLKAFESSCIGSSLSVSSQIQSIRIGWQIDKSFHLFQRFSLCVQRPFRFIMWSALTKTSFQLHICRM